MVTKEDFIESITDKTFIQKMVFLICLMLLFISIGYILANEKAITRANNYATKFVNENCYNKEYQVQYNNNDKRFIIFEDLNES